MRFFLKIILIFLLNIGISHSEILRVFEFTEDELKTLKTKKVKGETAKEWMELAQAFAGPPTDGPTKRSN